MQKDIKVEIPNGTKADATPENVRIAQLTDRFHYEMDSYTLAVWKLCAIESVYQ